MSDKSRPNRARNIVQNTTNNTHIENQTNTITAGDNAYINVTTPAPIIIKKTIEKPADALLVKTRQAIKENADLLIQMKVALLADHIKSDEKSLKNEKSNIFAKTRGAMNFHVKKSKIDEYTETDGQTALKWLQFEINKLKRNPQVQAEVPKSYDILTRDIQARLGQLKREQPQIYNDELIKKYLKSVYSITSINELNKTDLNKLYSYVMAKNPDPSFSTQRQESKDIFSKRIRNLTELLGFLKNKYGDFGDKPTNSKGAIELNSQEYGFGKKDVIGFLREKYPKEFGSQYTEKTIEAFWQKQQILKFNQGNIPKSLR